MSMKGNFDCPVADSDCPYFRNICTCTCENPMEECDDYYYSYCEEEEEENEEED